MVEELVVQSSLCPCPCVMDKAVQVQGLFVRAVDVVPSVMVALT